MGTSFFVRRHVPPPRKTDFPDLLQRVVPQIEARGGRVSGSTLGNLLRQAAPGFDPATYGAQKLFDLVEACPDIGRIERGGTSHEIAFVLQEHPQPGPALSAPQRRLKSGLWNVLVAAQPRHNAFIDLAFGRLSITLSPKDPPEAEEDKARFIPVLSLEQATMRSWAVEYALSQGLEQAAETIKEADDARWFPEFKRLLPTTSARAQWERIHKHKVEEYWEALAAAHDIKPDNGYESSTPKLLAKQKTTPGSLRPTIQNTTALRLLIHEAVDQMSEEELLALRIPLRYILSKSPSE